MAWPQQQHRGRRGGRGFGPVRSRVRGDKVRASAGLQCGRARVPNIVVYTAQSATLHAHDCTTDKDIRIRGNETTEVVVAHGSQRCSEASGNRAANRLTLTEKRGKRKPNLRDFLTSSSPWRTRVPGSGAPSSDGQKNPLPTLSRNTLLLRPVLSALSRVAWDPTRRTRTRCSRTAEGVARRSRACSSLALSVRVMGIGLPSAYES